MKGCNKWAGMMREGGAEKGKGEGDGSKGREKGNGGGIGGVERGGKGRV